jgi:DNA (cytosine-5)-methyltransferase 1
VTRAVQLPLCLGSLFSGIGGLDLAVEAVTGARTVWQVEADPWCRSVLARHWPDARRYDDVRTVGEELERVDIIAGGFPCQDVSVAGKRAGITGGERSGLWSEFARIVRVVRPRIVFVENVSGLLSMEFGRVLGDLAALGYAAEWGVFRASDAGAPHRRERVFVLAVADSERIEGIERHDADVLGRRSGNAEQAGMGGGGGGEGVGQSDAWGDRSQGLARAGAAERAVDRRDSGPRRAQPGVGRGADGLPSRMDGHRWPAGRGEAQHEWEPPRVAQSVPQRRQRLKALGNAVVPQQAALALRELAARGTSWRA